MNILKADTLTDDIDGHTFNRRSSIIYDDTKYSDLILYKKTRDTFQISESYESSTSSSVNARLNKLASIIEIFDI